MQPLVPKFITDNKGKKISVVLSIREYRKILDELEELEDIRLYDEAMADKQPSLPASKVFRFVEAKRKKK
ncbi:hypothetical protein [Pseudoflavitalea rhizosphaerae]|uniref:hypothetical protein n=1 Tax=Pseudoflavitalea rhizosphaerae TaxID=1884793 RepID=UPI000F8CB27C|nr:hypothetical protein [Pseudoflavitalea rhizosphaerae]